jgi:hypothetical protein
LDQWAVEKSMEPSGGAKPDVVFSID